MMPANSFAPFMRDFPAAAMGRHGVTGTLAVVCLFVLVAIPAAARRGALHLPGYSGLSMLSFVVAVVVGYVAGRPGIKGGAIGIALSFLFFVLLAAGIGCVLALAFYRPRPDERS